MKIPFSLKLGNLFFVTLFMAVFFGICYCRLFKIHFPSAMYRSMSIQTMGGNPLSAETDLEKALISIQYMTAYMMVSGIIIISFDTFA